MVYPSPGQFYFATSCFALIALFFLVIFLRGRRAGVAGNWLYLVSAIVSVCAALAFLRSALLPLP